MIHVLTFADSQTILYLMIMARRKIPLGLALEPDVIAALDEWIKSQPVPPSRTAAVEAAIMAFVKGKSDD
jgi:hypothetical protein